MNQIGSVSESIAAWKLCRDNKRLGVIAGSPGACIGVLQGVGGFWRVEGGRASGCCRRLGCFKRGLIVFSGLRVFFFFLGGGVSGSLLGVEEGIFLGLR